MTTCAHGVPWDQPCAMCCRGVATSWPPQQPLQLQPAPMGCICPPTSEKTCENPICPRQNPFKRATIGNDLNRPQTT